MTPCILYPSNLRSSPVPPPPSAIPDTDWRIALTRVEGKLDAIITANAALRAGV